MLVQMEHVAVDKHLWARVKAGDQSAVCDLQMKLNHLTLYEHALPVEDDEVIVTIWDLERAGVIHSIMLLT